MLEGSLGQQLGRFRPFQVPPGMWFPFVFGVGAVRRAQPLGPRRPCPRCGLPEGSQLWESYRSLTILFLPLWRSSRGASRYWLCDGCGFREVEAEEEEGGPGSELEAGSSSSGGSGGRRTAMPTPTSPPSVQ